MIGEQSKETERDENMRHVKQIKQKAYANSPYDLGTSNDNAYRNGVDEAINLVNLYDDEPSHIYTDKFVDARFYQMKDRA